MIADDARVDVRDLALERGDLPPLTGEVLLGGKRGLPPCLELAPRQKAPGRNVLAARQLLAGALEALLLQRGLSLDLLQFDAQVHQAGQGLLGFRVEPLDPRAGALARGLRLGAQLLRHHLADIAGGGLAPDPDLRQPGAAFHDISFLDADGLDGARGDGGCPDQALVGNEPAGDRRLARIGCHRSEQDDRNDDPAEEKPEQANRQRRGEHDRPRQPSRGVGDGFLAKEVAHDEALVCTVATRGRITPTGRGSRSHRLVCTQSLSAILHWFGRL